MDKKNQNEVVDQAVETKISVIEEALLNNVIGGAFSNPNELCCCECTGK